MPQRDARNDTKMVSRSRDTRSVRPVGAGFLCRGHPGVCTPGYRRERRWRWDSEGWFRCNSPFWNETRQARKHWESSFPDIGYPPHRPGMRVKLRWFSGIIDPWEGKPGSPKLQNRRMFGDAAIPFAWPGKKTRPPFSQRAAEESARRKRLGEPQRNPCGGKR